MKTSEEASKWISELSLSPLPEEGGWYRETWRSDLVWPGAALPAQFEGDRRAATLIHYLLQAGEFSALHRLRADEIWLFHAGGPLEIEVFHEGNYRQVRLGGGPDQPNFQAIIPAGAAFGAKPAPGTAFSLVSCVVSPGFEFQDFELLEKAEMEREFPEHRKIWESLIRDQFQA